MMSHMLEVSLILMLSRYPCQAKIKN